MDKVAQFFESDAYHGALGDFITTNCIFYDEANYSLNFAREKN